MMRAEKSDSKKAGRTGASGKLYVMIQRAGIMDIGMRLMRSNKNPIITAPLSDLLQWVSRKVNL